MSKHKSWKNIILSSGRPFEGTINGELNSISEIQNRGKYFFYRMNEKGVLVEHSVDFHAPFLCLEHTMRVDLFIEAKYRQPKTKWLFTASSFESPTTPNLSRLFVSIDAFCHDRRLDREFVDRHSPYYKLGSKHLELRPTAGEKYTQGTVDHGYRQLKFAIANRIADLLITEVSKDKQGVPSLYILVPLIVTSADLCVYKVDVTEEVVKSAGCLDELVEKADAILVYERPDPEVGRLIHHLLDISLSKSQHMRLTGKLRDAGYTSIEEFAVMIGEQYPTIFFVLQKRVFTERIVRLTEFLNCAEVVCSPGELLNRGNLLTGQAAVA